MGEESMAVQSWCMALFLHMLNQMVNTLLSSIIFKFDYDDKHKHFYRFDFSRFYR